MSILKLTDLRWTGTAEGGGRFFVYAAWEWKPKEHDKGLEFDPNLEVWEDFERIARIAENNASKLLKYLNRDPKEFWQNLFDEYPNLFYELVETIIKVLLNEGETYLAIRLGFHHRLSRWAACTPILIELPFKPIPIADPEYYDETNFMQDVASYSLVGYDINKITELLRLIDNEKRMIEARREKESIIEEARQLKQKNPSLSKRSIARNLAKNSRKSPHTIRKVLKDIDLS